MWATARGSWASKSLGGGGAAADPWIGSVNPGGYTACDLPEYLYNEDEIQFVFNYCFDNPVVLNHLPMVF